MMPRISYLLVFIVLVLTNLGRAQEELIRKYLNQRTRGANSNISELLGRSGGSQKSYTFPGLSSDLLKQSNFQSLGNGNIVLAGSINPETYILGPGDIILISLWGEQGLEWKTVVMPDGYLKIKDVSNIFVSGHTLNDAGELVTNAIIKKFKNISVTVNLIYPRNFKVHIVGPVRTPGMHVVSAVDRIFDVFMKASTSDGAGTSINISMRDIIIKRKDDTITADLISYLNTGNLDDNPNVHDGDIIITKPMNATIIISGAVNFPGEYDYKKGEKLVDFIKVAGGLTNKADQNKGELVRFKEDHKTIDYLSFNVSDVLNGSEDMELKEDDRIYIRSIPQFHKKYSITIKGEVRYPGVYSIDDGKTSLKDVVERAGGMTGKASLWNAKVIRSDSLRGVELYKLSQLSSFSKTSFIPIDEVGLFQTKLREAEQLVVVDFYELFKNNSSKADITLKDGDVIVIPEISNYVRVTGNVKYPGDITYNDRMSANDYIIAAGGYLKSANRSKIRIIKGNSGAILKQSEIKNIRPGDSVWVPEKEKVKLSVLFRDVLTPIIQVATLIILILQP